MGHWEPEAIVAFNDTLLHSAGSRWDDWQPFDSQWLLSAQHASFLTQARELFRREYPDGPLFVIKDPRISRFAGFWFDVLAAENVDCRVIVAVRSPGDVADSLEDRDSMQRGYAYLLWLRHSLDAEFGSRTKTRAFCTYDGLLQDWRGTVSRLQARLAMRFPNDTATVEAAIDGFLDVGHRHFEHAPRFPLARDDVYAWAETVFDIFARWSSDGEDPSDYPRLDAIRRKFDMASTAFAQLYSAGLGFSGGAGAGAALRLALEAELADASAAVIRQEEAIAQAQALLALRADEQRQRQDEIAQVQSRLQAEQTCRTDLERANTGMALDLAQAQSENAALERRLADALCTLAVQEAELTRRAEGYAWLQSVWAILMDAPTWWQYLPFKWSARRIIRRIYRERLFSPSSYRALHPDVRDHGIDPLRHYMEYGLAEGRDRQ